MHVVKKVSDQAIAGLITELKELPQVDMPVKHSFSDSVYVREIFMPKNSIIVGKKHKTKHLNIVQQGECMVYMDGKLVHIKAPYTFESDAGVQKILRIIEDTVWSTVHVTEEKDIDVLEDLLIEKEIVWRGQQ